MIRWVRLVSLAALVATGLFSTMSAGSQADDFGFRFSIRDCPTETFDSFSGRFSKELAVKAFPRPTASTIISLTEQQMATVLAHIDAIGFFDYPSRFEDMPPTQDVAVMFPYPTYHLEVVARGLRHTVTWQDKVKPSSSTADRLRDLCTLILGFIHDHPEYKRLPSGRSGCL